jgi:CRISPR/Cas system CSM-associated protein Csm4 (group 5 of RAMP superfamily)
MNKKYIPKQLNNSDKTKQTRELLKSIRLYKKHKYYTRKPLKSFTSKKSKHLKQVENIYGIKKLRINNNLSKKTGCSKAILKKIVNKGMGAYYSSGSRPNQTAKSWGMARLASAITGGPASKIDFHLLKNCDKKKTAYKLSKRLN